MGYKRIDDLLLPMRIDKGTSNPLLEGYNEGVDEVEDATDKEHTSEEEGATEEEDARKEEEAADVVDVEESDPKPIRQHGQDGSEVALFFELKLVPMER